jgi:NADPH:quinone reductase-like Zn-dependent oxidoreductase
MADTSSAEEHVMQAVEPPVIPETFEGVGYTRSRNGFPLEAVRVATPRPGLGQILIHVVCSSLNPLDYKLAELNFFGRTPPAVLGFDLAGIVVAVGPDVTRFAVGEQVAAMADSNGNGGWATGGHGGYALAREYYAAHKPLSVSFQEAAALPLCFIAAYLGLYGHVRKGDVVYIPGGGGGVGHLAIQLARHVFGAGTVISSGGTARSIGLARGSGADFVFDYKRDDVGAEIAGLTGGRGVDVVYDATYSERGFVDTARMVRDGGKWIVLGVGPGKTARTVETESPVAAILAERHASLINANMLRYFSEPALLDTAAEEFFRNALQSAMAWAAEKRVRPHVGKVIDGTLEAINAGLSDMKTGQSVLGKTVVVLDRARGAS